MTRFVVEQGAVNVGGKFAVDLTVGDGDIAQVYGRSGIGKSQLLRALANLRPLSSGRALLNGKTCHELGSVLWRSQVCYVAQKAPNMSGTPREFFHKIKSFRVREQHRLCAPSDDVVEAFCDQWYLNPACLDQPWAQLSGGESQRARLAIALSLRPPVLLLDECCSALDAAATAAVEASLNGQPECATIMVSHDVEQRARLGNIRVDLDALIAT
ncbi:unnamed protein product (mitochondrion) [Plasmodiophora brassicae]|uniref:ABC transporter domain-containing protein n=1 Tax=Plasmodiophora brassicae TaxID=37360 RepID=A0A0G4IUG3_PLABS|nr:hypothetical protein PBRA_006991 [Plasmodiophora brassicae]SPQ92947.1 unnamed protein product [Plasmodiophora brassicae]